MGRLSVFQQRYEAIKKQSDEETLRDMRRRINRLQQECSSYEQKVRRQTEAFGNSREEAKKKAATVVQSTPLEYETSLNLSPLEIIGIALGLGMVIGVVYLAIILDGKPLSFW